eukprot:Rmarinus@m.23314
MASLREWMADDTRQIGLAVSSYWVVSLSMVFLNKQLASGSDLGRVGPVFIVWFQTMIGAGCAYYYVMKRNRDYGSNAPVIQKSICRKLLPLSFFFAGTIVFKFLCLKAVEVTFYQVAGSLTIPFNVILTYVVLEQKTSLPCLLCCGIIVGGFLWGVEEEVHLSVAGVCYGLLFSVCASFTSVYTKRALELVDGSELLVTLYNNVNTAVILGVYSFLVEGAGLVQTGAIFMSSWDFFSLSVTGMFGFCMGLVTAWQINATSPLSHNVSSTCKAGMQSFLAYLVYRNPLTAGGAMSILVVVSGSALYTYFRRMEMRDSQVQNHEPLSNQPPEDDTEMLLRNGQRKSPSSGAKRSDV